MRRKDLETQEEKIIDFLKGKGISPNLIISACRSLCLRLDIVAVERALDKYEQLERNYEGDALVSKHVRHEDVIAQEEDDFLKLYSD